MPKFSLSSKGNWIAVLLISVGTIRSLFGVMTLVSGSNSIETLDAVVEPWSISPLADPMAGDPSYEHIAQSIRVGIHRKDGRVSEQSVDAHFVREIAGPHRRNVVLLMGLYMGPVSQKAYLENVVRYWFCEGAVTVSVRYDSMLRPGDSRQHEVNCDRRGRS